MSFIVYFINTSNVSSLQGGGPTQNDRLKQLENILIQEIKGIKKAICKIFTTSSKILTP